MSWLPKKTVLVPVDFSPPSFEAVRIARGMVEQESGLHVIHVVEPIALMFETGVAPTEVINDQTRMQEAERALKQRLEELHIGGAKAVVTLGAPGLEIADYAHKIDADLIVIPSHGYTGVKHLLLGSVAERVARHAKCPVLILRRGA